MSATQNIKIVKLQGGDEMVIKDGGKITEQAGGAILGRYALTAQAAIGTAASTYVIAPFAGTIESLSVVSAEANAGTKTVFTAKIATVAITHPTWEFSVSLGAGTAVAVVPTAANTVTAGQPIELISDGGSTNANLANYTVVIRRTS